MRPVARLARRGVAAAAAIVTVLASGAVAAQASGPPGWRVVQTLGPAAPMGARDLWLQRDRENKRTEAIRPLYLLHWNGKTWRRLALPAQTDGDLTQDGHGGWWMLGSGPAPGYRRYFYHLSGGRWSKRAVPATKGTTVQQIAGMFHIPGTTSVWATGEIIVPNEDAGGVVGAIWKYGS